MYFYAFTYAMCMCVLFIYVCTVIIYTLNVANRVSHVEDTSDLSIPHEIVASPQSKTKDDDQVADIALMGRQLTNPAKDEENIILADDSNVFGGHVDATDDFDDDDVLTSPYNSDDNVPEQKPEDETPRPIEETNITASKYEEIVVTKHQPVKSVGNEVAGELILKVFSIRLKF